MDKRNYILSNELTGNNCNSPVIEFAYQGPLLKFYGDKINNKTIQEHKYAEPRPKTYRDLKEYRDIVNLTQYGQGLSLTNGDTVYKFFNAVTEYETHFSGTAKKNKNEIKLNSLYHGVTAQRINKARKACLALCS